MQATLLIVILAFVVMNFIALRKMQAEIKSIKNDLSFIDKDSEDEAGNSMQGMISSMHDSLLSEIQNVDEKVEDIQDKISPSDDIPDDELYKKALEITLQTKKASTSLLQRRLKIGYSRAARLIDELEENGIISESNGSEPRKVLAKS